MMTILRKKSQRTPIKGRKKEKKYNHPSSQWKNNTEDSFKCNIELGKKEENVRNPEISSKDPSIIQNIECISNHNQKIKEDISRKLSGVDTKSVLESLASGKIVVSSAISDEESHTSVNSEADSTDSIVHTDEAIDHEYSEGIINPASLYSWIPVEGNQVFTDTYRGKNLLELSDDDNLEKEIPENTNKGKKKGKKYKHPISQCKNNTEDSFKRNDLLENIAHHSAQWSQYHAQPLEPDDPMKNIFKLSYDYMNKNAGHWIDALGDQYEPDEEIDCQAIPNNTPFEQNSCNFNNLDWMPDNDQSNHVPGNVNPDYLHNSTYTSYFDHYRLMFENDAPTFNDVSSFNNYYAQWKSQVQSVTNYVQQNIYLQEMNNYQFQQGQQYYDYPNNSSTNN